MIGDVVFHGVTTGRSTFRQASLRFLNMVHPAVELEVGDLLGELVLGGVLRMELLQVVGGRESAERVAPEAGVVPDAPHRGEHGRQGVVGLRRRRTGSVLASTFSMATGLPLMVITDSGTGTSSLFR